MKVLVTGATGLLGNNIVRTLLEENCDVRVLVRQSSDPRPLDGLNVETFCADLVDEADSGGEVLRGALTGVEAVVHSAGLIQIGWSKKELSLRVNRDATRFLAEACRMRGLRMVHISSVDALASGTRDRPATEEDIDPAKIPTSYVVSKRAGDEVMWEQMARGLDGIIVHPGLMFGPWDWKPSSGEMILAIAKQFVPFAPSGDISVCDVRDVAAGVTSAIRNGRTGENYILAGENLSFLELWRQIADSVGGRAPWGKLPRWLGAIVGAGSDAISKLRKFELPSNSGGIKMGSSCSWYSSDKAKRELGYRIGPVDVALSDARDWFRQFGYLK